MPTAAPRSDGDFDDPTSQMAKCIFHASDRQVRYGNCLYERNYSAKIGDDSALRVAGRRDWEESVSKLDRIRPCTTDGRSLGRQFPSTNAETARLTASSENITLIENKTCPWRQWRAARPTSVQELDA
jgi:hypothetical protein